VCCGSVLQCVAVYSSVLQCVAVCCSALQCVAVRRSASQCVAVRCSVLQCVALCSNPLLPVLTRHFVMCCSVSCNVSCNVLYYVAARMFQCVAGCRRVLQGVAVCSSSPLRKQVDS